MSLRSVWRRRRDEQALLTTGHWIILEYVLHWPNGQSDRTSDDIPICDLTENLQIYFAPPKLELRRWRNGQIECRRCRALALKYGKYQTDTKNRIVNYERS
jgi:hypothetical protein